MGWPYEFITLSEEEKELRRHTLDLYATIAHYSALTPALMFLIIKLTRYVLQYVPFTRQQYLEVPGSPAVKARRESGFGLAVRWGQFKWWMSDDVVFLGQCWGQKDQWILGVVWFVWLLALCIVGTGRDYLHLTKRLGLIAASQLPIQYLLSLKFLNPFSYIFTSSHEHINRYHQVLGRVIYILLILHIILYNIFFIESGIWLQRFFAPIVFAGVVASLFLHAMAGTALKLVRRWNYRVFFVTHLMAAFSIPVLIFFHAPSARVYVIEAIVGFIVDLGVRKATTITASATLEAVPGTNLLKIDVPLLKQGEKFRARPGSHIYLSIPNESRPSGSPSNLIFELMYNPFTVASVNDESSTITVIARSRNGPVTNHLATLASLGTKIPLSIEGPYGAAGKAFSTLLAENIDRVLLFAGGVGATFALPIYHALLAEKPFAKVKLIWAIRSAGDATWAVSTSTTQKSVLDDGNVQLFLTGDLGLSSSSDISFPGGIELTDLHRRRTSGSKKRPDVGKIVDDTFRTGLEETVAVMVCGPAEMARDVREVVRPWVMKGRNVWWHNEAFGW